MPFDVSREHVRKAEHALGVRFPESFVNPMLKSNGYFLEYRELSWAVHPLFDDSTKRRLQRSANDIVRETRAAREMEWFPPNAVCIGSADNGDRLVLLPEHDAVLGPAIHHWVFQGGAMVEVAATFYDVIAARS